MKKILSILISTTLLSACGGSSGGNEDTRPSPNPSPSASSSPNVPGEGSNTLEAIDDSFTVAAGTTVYLDVLANDRFSALSSVEIVLDSGSSYRVVDGKIEFTAPNSDTFLRSFNYQLNENGKSSELATVRVEQANDTGMATLNPESDRFVVQTNVSTDLDVLANDVSSIQSPLSVSEILLEPINGTVSIENDHLRYQSHENYSGTDRFTYRVQDSVGNNYGGVNVDILVEAKRSGRYTELYTTDIASFELKHIGQSLPQYYAKGSGYVNPEAAGDLNGDGFHDTIACVAQAPTMNNELQVVDEKVGECILTLGGPRDTISQRQYSIRGHQENERFGSLLSSAGDIDGDGFDDVVILSGSSSNFKAHILYGRAEFESPLTTSSTTDLSPLLSSSTISFAAAIGDVNNDNFADVAIQIIGNSDNRELQILFGGAQRLSGSIERDELDNRRFIYSPQLEAELEGRVTTRGSIRALGDYDGDGFDDFGLAGTLSLNTSTHNGAVIIFGQANYDSGSTTLDQLNTLFLSAKEFTSENQVNIGAVLDINGDMKKELFIQHGNEILIFDRKDNKQGSLALWDTNKQLGKITGFTTTTVVPYPAGDINNDGIEDLILNNISNSKPASAIIYGQNTITPSIDIDEFRFANGSTGEQGALIYSKRNSSAFNSRLWARGVGDMDGDGLDDFVVSGFLVEDSDDIADFNILYGANHWGLGD
ncbi:Ig-like domain-containing protein [Agaribacterium sp. ZY112]|uniref:Ig-like domain-containing protein n=1 Tax=Agaribacterium sp. ZY112 TaxID=3233574 RepID=UPI0035244B45